MELRDYLLMLRRRWLSVILVTLLVAGAAGIVMSIARPKYTATTQVFFAVQRGQSVSDLAQGSAYITQQMNSYAKVATSSLVLEPAIASLGLSMTPQQLAQSVTAEATPETVVLDVAVTDPSPTQAARLANAIGGQLTTVASALVPGAQASSSAVRATILTSAVAPDRPSSPRFVRDLGLAVLLGLILGMGVALVRHLADSKIRNEQDVKRLTRNPILGVVPLDPGTRRGRPDLPGTSFSARAAALHRLRINLSSIGVVGQQKPIIISSVLPGEGKTETAINLAASAAHAGLRVILVDADLRSPTIAYRLGLPLDAGLSTLLSGQAEGQDVVCRVEHLGVDVLPAGPVAPDSAELLSSQAMNELLARLGVEYDLVLVDTSPLLPVPVAIALSKAAGIVLVVGVDRIRRPELVDALESLATVNANVLGLVLNKVAPADFKAHVFGKHKAPVWDLPTEPHSKN